MAEQQYPEPTCGALIFNPEGKIFLMKSHKWRDKYVIPGCPLVNFFLEEIKKEVKKVKGVSTVEVDLVT